MDPHRQRQSLESSVGADRFYRAFQQFVHINESLIKLELASIQPADHQQVLEQLIDAIGRSPDASDDVADIVRQILSHEEFDQTHHAAQRGTHFVAHHGEQPGPLLGDFLSPFPCRHCILARSNFRGCVSVQVDLPPPGTYRYWQYFPQQHAIVDQINSALGILVIRHCRITEQDFRNNSLCRQLGVDLSERATNELIRGSRKTKGIDERLVGQTH